MFAQEERDRRHQARVQVCHIARVFSYLREVAVRGFRDGQIRLGNVVIDDDDAFDRFLRKLDRLEAAAKIKAYASGSVARPTGPALPINGLGVK